MTGSEPNVITNVVSLLVLLQLRRRRAKRGRPGDETRHRLKPSPGVSSKVFDSLVESAKLYHESDVRLGIVTRGGLSVGKHGLAKVQSESFRETIEHMRKITANDTHRHDDVCDTLYDAIKIALIDKTLTYNTMEDTMLQDIQKSDRIFIRKYY